MAFLQPYHPRLVHFPVALLLTGVALLLLGLWRHREQWIGCGRLALFLGWLGTLVAALSGLIDQSRAPDTPAVAATINQHITAGIGLIVVFGLALYWPLRARGLWTRPSQRTPYLALLVLGAGLVILEAWLGGRLVYSLGVGVASH